MVVVTIVAASVITAAVDGITGDGAVPADGTGITGKHSVTDSVKDMMPASAMDSGKDGTMTADRVDLEVRGGREMAAIPDADAAELWEISIPLMCVVNS